MPRFEVDRDILTYNEGGMPHIARGTAEVEADTFQINENGALFYKSDGGPCAFYRSVQSVRRLPDEPQWPMHRRSRTGRFTLPQAVLMDGDTAHINLKCSGPGIVRVTVEMDCTVPDAAPIVRPTMQIFFQSGGANLVPVDESLTPGATEPA